jgi:hypothetical protein
MREELSNLGCEWPIRDYSFEAKQNAPTGQTSTLQQGDVLGIQSSSSRKRKHSPTGADHDSGQSQAVRIHRRTSKDMMPPPYHPASESFYDPTVPYLPSTRSTLPARSHLQRSQNSHEPPSNKQPRNMANFPIKRTEVDRDSSKPHQVSSSYTLGRTVDAASNESARILARPPIETGRVADSGPQWLPSNLRSSVVSDHDMVKSSRTAPIDLWRRGDINNDDDSSHHPHQSQPRPLPHPHHWHRSRDLDPIMPNLNRPADLPYSSPFFARATLAHPVQQPQSSSYYNGTNEASQWQQPTMIGLPLTRGYSRAMQTSEQGPATFADYSGHRPSQIRCDESYYGPIPRAQRSLYTFNPPSDHLTNDQALHSSYGLNFPDQQSIRHRPRGRISLPPSKTQTLRRSDSVLLSQLPGVRGIHSSQRAPAVAPVPARGSRPPEATHNKYRYINHAYPTAGSGSFPSAPGRRSARR